MTTKKKKDDVIMVLRPNQKTVQLRIEGISPLILHRFSEKALKMISEKQAKTAKKARKARDPISDVVYATHFMERVDREEIVSEMKEGGVVPGDDITKYFKKYHVAFPAAGFKQCGVAACRAVDGIDMVFARGAFFILNDMVEINYKRVIFREDFVRLGAAGGSADLRYRPMFTDWTASLMVEIDPTSMSLSQVANLLALGGSKVGVGEWRPTGKNSSGDFGRFKLLLSEEKIAKAEKRLMAA